jgi:hypothetical protein
MLCVNCRTIWSSAGDARSNVSGGGGFTFRLSDQVRAILTLADQARINEKKDRMICG